VSCVMYTKAVTCY